MLASDLVTGDDTPQVRTIRPFGASPEIVRMLPGRYGIVAWRGGRHILLVSTEAPVAPAIVARHLVDDHPPGLDDETWETLFCDMRDCETALRWAAAAAICKAAVAGEGTRHSPSYTP